MAMMKIVANKIKSFTKEIVKKAGRICHKCGSVLELEKECDCGSRGKTQRVSDKTDN